MSHASMNPAEQADLRRRVWLESERLAEEFAGTFGIQTINQFVLSSFESMQNARIVDFVPVLTRRFARERLLALAQSTGQRPKNVPEILYVCVQNAGRSQMAAALTQQIGGDRVSVRSAGSMPADQVSPNVVTAMAEVGIDLAEAYPKPLSDEVVQAADAVITMGCGDACPIYPGKRYLDWELDDPADTNLDGVRVIRDDIRRRVEALLAELGVTTVPA